MARCDGEGHEKPTKRTTARVFIEITIETHDDCIIATEAKYIVSDALDVGDFQKRIEEIAAIDCKVTSALVVGAVNGDE